MRPSPLHLITTASLLAAHLLVAPEIAAQRGTLIVSNMNDHTATIIDAATSRVLATVPTGEGPHEVAVSHDGRTALVSNYGVRGKPGNSITVIDVARAAVARTLTLEGYQRPHGMAFLPGDTIVAVTSEVASAVLLVDVRSGRVTDTVQTRGRASHMIALTANGMQAYVANIADNTVSALAMRRSGTATGAGAGRDSARLIRVARTPEGLAVSPDGAQLWVGSNRDSVVLVIDARRGMVVDTLRGFGLPYRMAVTPDGKTAVITDPVNGDVRLVPTANRRAMRSVAMPRDSLLATAEVPGSPSPEGIALSRDSRWAFVTLQGRNRVVTIDLARGVITASAPTGTWSDGVGFSPVAR
jgi:YVTN family beta-propeller protein